MFTWVSFVYHIFYVIYFSCHFISCLFEYHFVYYICYVITYLCHFICVNICVNYMICLHIIWISRSKIFIHKSICNINIDTPIPIPQIQEHPITVIVEMKPHFLLATVFPLWTYIPDSIKKKKLGWWGRIQTSCMQKLQVPFVWTKKMKKRFC